MAAAGGWPSEGGGDAAIIWVNSPGVPNPPVGGGVVMRGGDGVPNENTPVAELLELLPDPSGGAAGG